MPRVPPLVLPRSSGILRAFSARVAREGAPVNLLPCCFGITVVWLAISGAAQNAGALEAAPEF